MECSRTEHNLGVPPCQTLGKYSISGESLSAFCVQGEDGICKMGLLPFPLLHSNEILYKYLLTPSSMEIKNPATKYSF